jgi:hypothetical protein
VESEAFFLYSGAFKVIQTMQVSAEIKKKLAFLIGNLISRCIREARMIPHVLSREEVIDILLGDPVLYEKLVQNEHAQNTELSKEDLTIKIDVARELEKLDVLDLSDPSFWDGPEVDLTSILNSTNDLTRTFSVYIGNAATLFDRAFEDFMNKFRQSLQRAGMTLKTVDFTLNDVAVLETNAVSSLTAGEFLQAFTFERLLSSQIMMRQVVNLPAKGFSLREDLIRYALTDQSLAVPLIKFVIRISYISQAAWDDLFPTVVRQVCDEAVLCTPAQLVELIEQDVVFSCNLLCGSYAEIREWPAAQRRSALENCIKSCRDKAGQLRVASPDP